MRQGPSRVRPGADRRRDVRPPGIQFPAEARRGGRPADLARDGTRPRAGRPRRVRVRQEPRADRPREPTRVEVAVADKIADLADLYGPYGIKLRYRRLSTLTEAERTDPRVYILPPGWLRPPLDDSVSWLGSIRLRTAYVSGWCAFFDYTRQYGLDAQFPLSDHGDFEDVMAFIEACRPRKVYTAFSSAKDLAKAVERRFKIKAEPLMAR